MLEILETFLRPVFAVSAIAYLGLAIRVSRSAPQYANSVIALFLALVAMFLAGAAFSYGTEDETVFGVGRVLTFAASGFMPVAVYVVYREYTIGPPPAIFVTLLGVIPVATTVLALTNPLHHMLWTTVTTDSGVGFSNAVDHIWYTRIQLPFMYGLIGYSLLALAGRLPSIAPAHRKTVLLLICSAVLPLLVSVANNVLRVGPNDFPFTSLTLVLMLPAMTYAAVSMRFYEFSPLGYRTLFDHVRDPIIVVDAMQRIICTNKSAQELLAADQHELIGRHLWEDFEEARRILNRAKDLDLTQTLRLDSNEIYEVSVRPLTGPRGQNLGMVVVCRDVTERRQAQARLAESEQLVRSLIETSSNGILRFQRSRDDGGIRFRCIFANRAAEAFLGEGRGALVGMPLDKLRQLDPQKLIEHFKSGASADAVISYDTENEREDGDQWLRIVGEPVGDDFSVTLIDITQRKRSESKMLADALRDPLTGVLNRRGFENEGAACIRRSKQGAVLYLDLNNFKSINDRFGHQAGDALLKAFGHRLEFCLRPEDVLGRLGGDEFAIVLPDITVDDAKHVATRLVLAAQEAYIIHGQEIRCTASLGIALMPRHGEELWHLISVADHAMYRVKGIENDEAANDPAAYIEAATSAE